MCEYVMSINDIVDRLYKTFKNVWISYSSEYETINSINKLTKAFFERLPNDIMIYIIYNNSTRSNERDFDINVGRRDSSVLFEIDCIKEFNIYHRVTNKEITQYVQYGRHEFVGTKEDFERMFNVIKEKVMEVMISW